MPDGSAGAPISPWRIALFGGLSAERDGVAIARFPTHKTAALLAYLAYHPGRAQSRDALLALLWPDVVPASARNSLSKALSSLRALLRHHDEPILIADHALVRLDPDRVRTDVAAFLAALQEAERAADAGARREALARAVALYRGELLPDLHEEWVLRERGWLAERFFQALEALVGLMEAAGEYGGALELAHRGMALDPLREEIARCLMRLYAATGRPGLARRHLRELERVLRAELDAAPGPETMALLRQIDLSPSRSLAPSLPGPAAPSPRRPLSPLRRLPLPLTPFFGREAEIARARQMLLGEGRRLVTLTGPGGSGKSRLALEVAAALQGAFADGACFVELAALREPELLLGTLGQVLGVRQSAEQPLLESLTEFLREKALLW